MASDPSRQVSLRQIHQDFLSHLTTAIFKSAEEKLCFCNPHMVVDFDKHSWYNVNFYVFTLLQTYWQCILYLSVCKQLLSFVLFLKPAVLVMRKTVFGVSDLVQHKSACKEG